MALVGFCRKEMCVVGLGFWIAEETFQWAPFAGPLFLRVRLAAGRAAMRMKSEYPEEVKQSPENSSPNFLEDMKTSRLANSSRISAAQYHFKEGVHISNLIDFLINP